jgi:hypothetical protein
MVTLVLLGPLGQSMGAVPTTGVSTPHGLSTYRDEQLATYLEESG